MHERVSYQRCQGPLLRVLIVVLMVVWMVLPVQASPHVSKSLPQRVDLSISGRQPNIVSEVYEFKPFGSGKSYLVGAMVTTPPLGPNRPPQKQFYSEVVPGKLLKEVLDEINDVDWQLMAEPLPAEHADPVAIITAPMMGGHGHGQQINLMVTREDGSWFELALTEDKEFRLHWQGQQYHGRNDELYEELTVILERIQRQF